MRLPSEMQWSAAAATAMGLSLLLPWYQKSFFVRGEVVKDNLSAFGVFTFVEAAVLLVAIAVLLLIYARSQRRAFHLPGGDGTAITIAGGWSLLLLVWRLFDTPSIHGPGATIGIQWGIFGALVAAAALLATGLRVRETRRPEPPNPVADADDAGWIRPERRPRDRSPERRPRDSSAVTAALRERPSWSDEARARRRAGDDDAPPPSESARRYDDEPTRRLPDERRSRDDEDTWAPDEPPPPWRSRYEEETRRLPEDAPPGARRSRHDDDTRRLPEEPPPSARRSRHDDDDTRRLPEDEAPPRRRRD